MKNRLQRRAATRIAKLNADLDAGNKQEFKLRQDLETAKAKYEKLQAKKKVRLEASVKSELGEAEEQVRRAHDTFDQAGIATETAMTTANASRQGTQSGSNHFYLGFELCHIPPSPPRAILSPMSTQS